MPRHRTVPLLVAAIILLVGAWARFARLADASLWLDEAHSLRYAGLPWSTLWLTGYDNTPPLYYSLLKLALLLGDTEFILRLPSALAGIATIPLVYWAGHLLSGPWAGFGAALFLALSAAQIEYSQEARAYSLLVFNLTLALVGLLLLLRHSRNPGNEAGRGGYPRQDLFAALLYSTGSLLALYTHNIAVFFVLCAQLVAARHWWRDLGFARRFMLLWLVINAAVLLLWLPWLRIIVFELARNGTFDWLTQSSPTDAMRELRYVHGIPLAGYTQPWIDLLLVLLWARGVYALREQKSELFLLLSVALIAPWLIWVAGYIEPMFMRRTILWSGLGSALLFGVSVSHLRRARAATILVLIGVTSALSASSFHASNEAENEDWKGAHAWLQEKLPPIRLSQAVLLCRPSGVLPLRYYARNDAESVPWLVWGGRFGLRSRFVKERHGPVPASQFGWSRLAVVASRCRPYELNGLQESLRRNGWELQSQENLTRIKLYLYRCDPGCQIPG